MSLAVFLLDCRLGRSSDNSIFVALESWEWSFKKNLAACLWTDLSFWMLTFVWGSYTEKTYSRIDEP